MTLIVLTVVVIAVLIAVLTIYLFVIGVLPNRTAGNLDDCAPELFGRPWTALLSSSGAGGPSGFRGSLVVLRGWIAPAITTWAQDGTEVVLAPTGGRWLQWLDPSERYFVN